MRAHCHRSVLLLTCDGARTWNSNKTIKVRYIIVITSYHRDQSLTYEGHHFVTGLQSDVPHTLFNSALDHLLSLAELQSCPFSNVVFQYFPFSVFGSSSIQCALHHLLVSSGEVKQMAKPLQFESFCKSIWAHWLVQLFVRYGRGLCMRCVVSCSHISFAWFVFLFQLLCWC